MRRVLIAGVLLIIVSLLGIPLWVFKGFAGTPPKTGGREPVVRVLNKKTGQLVNLPLEQYLVGVVAAEMPADFEMEALKAQAIAARTYTMRRMFAYGGNPNEVHPNAEICTDPIHCQAWKSDSELQETWGAIKYIINLEKVKQAVHSTEGLVITANSRLIEPVYHGSCGGKGTENSEDVWGQEIPYLRSVDCAGEYKAAEQKFTVELTMPELLARLNIKTVPALAKGLPVTPEKKSLRGRIQELKVSDRTITGAELRQKLGLTSTLLSWQTVGDKIIFTSLGKGHAVGLCQYGANGLALNGSGYRQIIEHYYTGVHLQKLKY